MGTGISKIDAKERVRTYKLVNLVEAREQFTKLAESAAKDIANSTHPFHTCPVMRNFRVAWRSDFISGGSVLDVRSSGGVEVDGRSPEWSTLYYLLENKVKIRPSTMAESYYLGLDKQQYDALYLPASKSTMSAISSS